MERDVFSIKENRLSYGRGYAYSLQYHLVWCTKYRKKVDHIHLLVDCRPQFFISDMIKIMKGNLARQMFLAHPELKQELRGGHLWNPSYCAVTVSDRSREQVLAYIESQKENKSSRKRKSKKTFSETERSSLEAKVPSVKRRTSCVYADLRLLHAELEKCRIA